jgi:DNA-binding NarL/FixJ family response regulator
MPAASTCEHLSTFRRAHPQIPVVIVGAPLDARSVERLLDKQAFAYIETPFTVQHIDAVIRGAIAGDSPR